MYYIYKIQNKKNGKIYIGLTNNIVRRKTRHFTDLRCNRHDNSFLQKEFNIYGEENFSFSVEYEGDIDYKEISDKEKEYIKKYDSYRNGYNQNEGGNFGPSNGGSHLTQSDVFNILSALEFCSRPGGVLSKIYDISLTTVSRIKKGENHIQYKEEYNKLPIEERKKIYKNFCDSTNFYIDKINTTIIKTKRKLTKEQVFMVLANFEYKIKPSTKMAEILNIKSTHTLDCIKQGISYKDYKFEYDNLSSAGKERIVSLLRN